IGSVDTDETQLAQALGNGIRVLAYIAGKCLDRIAGPLTNALDVGGGIAIEYCAVLGESNRSRHDRHRRWLCDPVRTEYAARPAPSPRAALRGCLSPER